MWYSRAPGARVDPGFLWCGLSPAVQHTLQQAGQQVLHPRWLCLGHSALFGPTCSSCCAIALENRMGSMMTPASLITAGRVRLRKEESAVGRQGGRGGGWAQGSGGTSLTTAGRVRFRKQEEAAAWPLRRCAPVSRPAGMARASQPGAHGLVGSCGRLALRPRRRGRAAHLCCTRVPAAAASLARTSPESQRGRAPRGSCTWRSSCTRKWMGSRAGRAG